MKTITEYFEELKRLTSTNDLNFIEINKALTDLIKELSAVKILANAKLAEYFKFIESQLERLEKIKNSENQELEIAYEHFLKLQKLLENFRQTNLILPPFITENLVLKNPSAHSDIKSPSGVNLTDMAFDILRLIFSELPFKDRKNMALTCKGARQIINGLQLNASLFLKQTPPNPNDFSIAIKSEIKTMDALLKIIPNETQNLKKDLTEPKMKLILEDRENSHIKYINRLKILHMFLIVAIPAITLVVTLAFFPPAAFMAFSFSLIPALFVYAIGRHIIQNLEYKNHSAEVEKKFSEQLNRFGLLASQEKLPKNESFVADSGKEESQALINEPKRRYG